MSSARNELSAARIEGALQTARYGRSLTFLPSTASTMDDAHRAAADGAPEGHVVVADHQTAGRGSHGRSWESPAGTDVYFSVVLRPTVEAGALAPLTLAAGLGVRNAIAAGAPNSSVTIKWPNDVLLDGLKCAGLLVESRTSGTRIDAVILGVGINVNRERWPDELEGAATSLREVVGEPIDRAEFLASVLVSLERAVDRFFVQGTSATAERLAPHLALIGESVVADGVEGVFTGVAPDGAALIETTAGTERVRSGRLLPL